MPHTSSTKFQGFRIVAHMKTPAIIQGDLTLESLLAACVYEQTGLMREDALAEVPLAKLETPEGAIWQASAVMFSGRVKLSEHIVVRGRHFSETGDEFYAANARARKDPWAVSQNSGDYKRLMNAYPVHEVERLVWYATGDMLACQTLLSTLKWVGKRHASGFGEIAQIDATPWSGNPLLDDNGMVRRPIAIRKLPHLEGAVPSEQQRVINCVDNHPSWAHPAELCAAPVSRLEPRAPAPRRNDPEMFFFD